MWFCFVCVLKACFLVCVYVCALWNSKTKAHPIICLGCVCKEFPKHIAYHVVLKQGPLNTNIPCHVFLFSACVRV